MWASSGSRFFQYVHVFVLQSICRFRVRANFWEVEGLYGRSYEEYCSETLRSDMIVFIRECQSMGYCPSRKEIGAKVGRAPSVVNKHLHRMANDGVLELKGVRRIEFL